MKINKKVKYICISFMPSFINYLLNVYITYKLFFNKEK